MSALLACAAFLLSALFFLAGGQKKYVAICVWTLIVISLFSDVPASLKADNLLYPALALLSVPFLALTVTYLFRNDPVILQLSKAAAIATLIFVPFACVPVLRDALVQAVVNQVFWIIVVFGHHPHMSAWNIIMENDIATLIILRCTGIMVLAMMTGIIAGVPALSWKQGVTAFLVIIPLLYLLNLLRVAFVFIAVSDAWFWFLPNLTNNPGRGASDFFWAHNVFAEALAIAALVAIIIGLSRMMPNLAVFARELVDRYLGGITAFFRSEPDTR